MLLEPRALEIVVHFPDFLVPVRDRVSELRSDRADGYRAVLVARSLGRNQSLKGPGIRANRRTGRYFPSTRFVGGNRTREAWPGLSFILAA
jgi:hypothetical protein